MVLRYICLTLMLTFSFAVFANTQQDTRFQLLTHEIRCVVCQNQNIADSEAPLASDLRLKVRDLIGAGKTDEEIKNYLVARYGEFILFKPRLNETTWFLWFFPLIAILIFSCLLGMFLKNKQISRP